MTYSKFSALWSYAFTVKAQFTCMSVQSHSGDFGKIQWDVSGCFFFFPQQCLVTSIWPKNVFCEVPVTTRTLTTKILSHHPCVWGQVCAIFEETPSRCYWKMAFTQAGCRQPKNIMPPAKAVAGGHGLCETQISIWMLISDKQKIKLKRRFKGEGVWASPFKYSLCKHALFMCR